MLDLAFREGEIILKVFLSVVIGFIIGIERKEKLHGLGSRTCSLICLGACLFTIGGTLFFNETNLARIAQGLAAGIGFIGAALIWRKIKHEETWVHGLTSAATVWMITALGFVIGAGLYLLAIVSLIIIIIILIIKRFGIE